MKDIPDPVLPFLSYPPSSSQHKQPTKNTYKSKALSLTSTFYSSNSIQGSLQQYNAVKFRAVADSYKILSSTKSSFVKWNKNYYKLPDGNAPTSFTFERETLNSNSAVVKVFKSVNFPVLEKTLSASTSNQNLGTSKSQTSVNSTVKPHDSQNIETLVSNNVGLCGFDVNCAIKTKSVSSPDYLVDPIPNNSHGGKLNSTQNVKRSAKTLDSVGFVPRSGAGTDIFLTNYDPTTTSEVKESDVSLKLPIRIARKSKVLKHILQSCGPFLEGESGTIVLDYVEPEILHFVVDYLNDMLYDDLATVLQSPVNLPLIVKILDLAKYLALSDVVHTASSIAAAYLTSISCIESLDESLLFLILRKASIPELAYFFGRTADQNDVLAEAMWRRTASLLGLATLNEPASLSTTCIEYFVNHSISQLLSVFMGICMYNKQSNPANRAESVLNCNGRFSSSFVHLEEQVLQFDKVAASLEQVLVSNGDKIMQIQIPLDEITRRLPHDDDNWSLDLFGGSHGIDSTVRSLAKIALKKVLMILTIMLPKLKRLFIAYGAANRVMVSLVLQPTMSYHLLKPANEPFEINVSGERADLVNLNKTLSGSISLEAQKLGQENVWYSYCIKDIDFDAIKHAVISHSIPAFSLHYALVIQHQLECQQAGCFASPQLFQSSKLAKKIHQAAFENIQCNMEKSTWNINITQQTRSPPNDKMTPLMFVKYAKSLRLKGLSFTELLIDFMQTNSISSIAMDYMTLSSDEWRSIFDLILLKQSKVTEVKIENCFQIRDVAVSKEPASELPAFTVCKSIASLLSSPLSNIQTLSLRNSLIDSTCGFTLAKAIAKCPTLRELDLSGCTISSILPDIGKSIVEHCSLSSVLIMNCDLQPRHIEKLFRLLLDSAKASKWVEKLSQLDISGNFLSNSIVPIVVDFLKLVLNTRTSKFASFKMAAPGGIVSSTNSMTDDGTSKILATIVVCRKPTNRKALFDILDLSNHKIGEQALRILSHVCASRLVKELCVSIEHVKVCPLVHWPIFCKLSQQRNLLHVQEEQQASCQRITLVINTYSKPSLYKEFQEYAAENCNFIIIVKSMKKL